MESITGIIFGASGGIGSELARNLSARGWNLVLAGRDVSALRPLLDETGARGVQADPTVENQAAACFEGIGTGPVGVVNCVGSIHLKPAHRTSAADWEDVLRVNLTSSFHILKAAAPVLQKAGGGSLVFMSSVAASFGLANHESIAAAKAGVEGLVRSAAATYASKNIRVNGVAPGLTRTPMTASLTENDAVRKASEAMHPLGRIGDPRDIASAIAWLLDPSNHWVTGEIIHVDGGLGRARGR